MKLQLHSTSANGNTLSVRVQKGFFPPFGSGINHLHIVKGLPIRKHCLILSLLLFEVRTFCLLQKGSLSPFITFLSPFLSSLRPFFYRFLYISISDLLTFDQLEFQEWHSCVEMIAPYWSRKGGKPAHSCGVHRRVAEWAAAPALSVLGAKVPFSNGKKKMFLSRFPVHQPTEEIRQNYLYSAKNRWHFWWVLAVCAHPANTMSTLSPQYSIYHRALASLLQTGLLLDILSTPESICAHNFKMMNEGYFNQKHQIICLSLVRSAS